MPISPYLRDEASARNGYALNRLDRRSETRGEASVADALRQESARLYLFAGEKPVLRPNGAGFEPLFPEMEARLLGCRTEGAVLLGFREDGTPLLAAQIDQAAPELDRLNLIDLRTLAVDSILPPEHLGALAQAKSLLHWHARHGFCANCGTATTMACGGYRRDCGSCGATHFPRTDPVVIMLAIDGESCLLARQPRFQPGMYSALAGFVEPGETIEDAVRREIGEEASISIGAVRYYSSQPWPFPASLMIGCHCQALDRDIRLADNELEAAAWFGRGEVGAMLARDHPDGLFAPPAIAIAHQLIRAFVEAGSDLLARR